MCIEFTLARSLSWKVSTQGWGSLGNAGVLSPASPLLSLLLLVGWAAFLLTQACTCRSTCENLLPLHKSAHGLARLHLPCHW